MLLRWSLLILGTACASEVDDFAEVPEPEPGVPQGDWRPVAHVDEGSLCFTEEAPRLRIDVEAPACVAADCVRDVQGQCVATLDGARIVVQSEVRWEQDFRGSCGQACETPAVSCNLALPEAGTYTVAFGGEEAPLTIPLAERCLFEAAGAR